MKTIIKTIKPAESNTHGILGGLLLLAALILLSSCTDDDNSSKVSLSSAWNNFESGNWEAAEDGFLFALEKDQNYAEAWCGLGWCQAMLQTDLNDPRDYRESIVRSFLEADQLQADYGDAIAGMASFQSYANDTLKAIEWAEDLLSIEGDTYVFNHRQIVTSRLMRKIAAWNYYKFRNYSAALEHVQAVFSGFSPDPLSENYLEELLAAISDM
jgi:tetratricopeptide (TPR) repeat protein